MQQIEAQPSMKRPLDSLFSVEKEDGWTTITVRRVGGLQPGQRLRVRLAGGKLSRLRQLLADPLVLFITRVDASKSELRQVRMNRTQWWGVVWATLRRT